jgi:tetratricopeptide (TPR) repeat protein
MKSLPLRALGALICLAHFASGEKITEIGQAIPDAVMRLPAPTNSGVPTGITLAVTTASESTQTHVNMGLNHLHFGWEFEAARHFAAAMREDPNCLLAHWGMIMALLEGAPETIANRNAAAERMVSLIEANAGSPLERDYSYALLKQLTDGPEAAANAFRKVAGHFPNDMHSGVLVALFTRGGYDVTGEATPDQENSEKMLLEWIRKMPGNPVPMNALVTICAEAPDLSKSLLYARELSAAHSEYPPFQHLLGHCEWRCGNLREALNAFSKSAALFEKWMNENKVSAADCPEWLDAQCYRIVTLNSMGRRQEAFDAAIQLSETQIPAERKNSPGARVLWWDIKTLPTRLALDAGALPQSTADEKLLPTADAAKDLMKHSLAHWWINGLRLALETQRQIQANQLDKARNTINALSQHGEMMAASQKLATQSAERSEWNRAFRALEMITANARGQLAIAGSEENRNIAYNWFSAAADRQTASPMMKAPLVLTPMAGQIGEYFMAINQAPEAIEAFEKALKAFPNDSRLIERLTTARESQSKAATPASDPAKQLDR